MKAFVRTRIVRVGAMTEFAKIFISWTTGAQTKGTGSCWIRGKAAQGKGTRQTALSGTQDTGHRQHRWQNLIEEAKEHIAPRK